MATIGIDWTNQDGNIVAGDPDPAPGPTTEEMIGDRRAVGALGKSTRQGHDAITRHIRNTDRDGSSVDELVRSLDWLFAQKMDHAFSMHSDAAGHQDVLPLICRREDAAIANRIAERLAKGIGMTTDPASYRTDLAWCHRLVRRPAGFGLLLEIGVHGPSGGPLYNAKGPAMLWRFGPFHGAAAAQACLKEWGLLRGEGNLPASIEVPPGFEYWHGGLVIPPPDPSVLPVFALGSRILYLDDDPRTPLMRGTDVRELQHDLNLLIPADTTITRATDGKHATMPIDEDGILGAWSEAAIIHYQSNHWYLGVHLVADGWAGPKTIAKIRSVLQGT